MRNTVYVHVVVTVLAICEGLRALVKQEKMFFISLQSSFRFWDNQILIFQIFKCHDVIKYLSMKHKTYFIE